MKINMKALLVMLTAFSVLPGCGKSNGTAVATGGVASVSAIGSGQCATVTYNSAITLTFYGQLQSGVEGIQGNLSAYGYGSQSFGGSNYYRNLSTGDSLNVYVSGTTAYAVLSIAAATAAAIVQGQSSGYGGGYGGGYSGTAQVCGLALSESIIAGGTSGAGFTGTMGGGYAYLWGNNNWITYGNGQPIGF